ncbi:MAG: Holliday junction branch migration protein RuvA [Myxococcaceae bacterium]
MIAYLTGQLQAKNLRSAVILISGVGYRVSMPLSDLSHLGELGQQVSVHVHTHVREDALELFGFLSEESLVCFEQLISVSGIGPKMALGVLSGMETAELAETLVSGDYVKLTRIPGIGPKTAQRLVLELKDKMKPVFPLIGFGGVLSDLRSAISNLGYKPNQVEKAVKSVEHLAKQNQPLGDLLREALREIHA